MEQPAEVAGDVGLLEVFALRGLSMTDVTHILSSIERGDPHAAEQLLPLVHDELCRLAAPKLTRDKPEQTLQMTDLDHEAKKMLLPCAEEASPRS